MKVENNSLYLNQTKYFSDIYKTEAVRWFNIKTSKYLRSWATLTSPSTRGSLRRIDKRNGLGVTWDDGRRSVAYNAHYRYLGKEIWIVDREYVVWLCHPEKVQAISLFGYSVEGLGDWALSREIRKVRVLMSNTPEGRMASVALADIFPEAIIYDTSCSARYGADGYDLYEYWRLAGSGTFKDVLLAQDLADVESWRAPTGRQQASLMVAPETLVAGLHEILHKCPQCRARSVMRVSDGWRCLDYMNGCGALHTQIKQKPLTPSDGVQRFLLELCRAGGLTWSQSQRYILIDGKSYPIRGHWLRQYLTAALFPCRYTVVDEAVEVLWALARWRGKKV